MGSRICGDLASVCYLGISGYRVLSDRHSGIVLLSAIWYLFRHDTGRDLDLAYTADCSGPRRPIPVPLSGRPYRPRSPLDGPRNGPSRRPHYGGISGDQDTGRDNRFVLKRPHK